MSRNHDCVEADTEHHHESRFVALLRGVNVGKGNRVPMATFRTLLEALGFTAVETLLNSGNATFTSAGRSAAAHAQAIHGAIQDSLGIGVPVVVKPAAEFLASITECSLALVD